MLTSIILCKYNNYYNRIVRKMDAVSDYGMLEGSTTIPNYNFYFNDGVNTKIVVNYSVDTLPFDYLVNFNQTDILSRWFIMESKNIRNGQWELTLRRDVIVDNYNSVVGATMYIEKATIQDSNDIAIYNKENIELNRIKKSESALRDTVGVPWLVGYFSKTTPTQEINIEATNFNAINVNSVGAWEYFDYISRDYKYVTDWDVSMYFSLQPSFIANGGGMASMSGDYNVDVDALLGYAGQFRKVPKGKDNRLSFCSSVANFLKTRRTTIQTWFETEKGYKFNDNISNLDGKYLYASNASTGFSAGYYKISVSREEATDSGYYTYSSNEEIWFNSLLENQYDNYYYIPYVLQDSPYRNVNRDLKYIKYRITLTQVSSTALKFTFPSDPKKLTDAPYGMFCIPADRVLVQMPSGQTDFFSLTRQEAINAATTIATALSTNCYDLQLLPYCPFDEDRYNMSLYSIDSKRFTGPEKAFIVDESDNNKGIVLFASTSSFTKDVYMPIVSPSNVVNRKVAVQSDLYRLCSPNYSSVFEFNEVKTGTINYFNVDCTYKPYNPYMHIVPKWKSGSLYGSDFDDTRGLICQGEFSVPVLSDQWKAYQLNNKNYLNAFNREIDSLELQNRYAQIDDIASAVVGTAQGAMSGFMMGGGYGAIAGAAVSGIAGAVDVGMNKQLREENIALTKDRFNYNLQNIQAAPRTIAKVSSFDYNNKVFPVLEYYSCTNEERVIFKNKMRYNGMTIMRMGTISEFLNPNEQNYVKGQLVRVEDISEDYHMLSTIKDELEMGVYI